MVSSKGARRLRAPLWALFKRCTKGTQVSVEAHDVETEVTIMFETPRLIISAQKEVRIIADANIANDLVNDLTDAGLGPSFGDVRLTYHDRPSDDDPGEEIVVIDLTTSTPAKAKAFLREWRQNNS